MKKALLLTAVITAAVAAKASVLLWQVTESDYSSLEGYSEVAYARLMSASGVDNSAVSAWNAGDKRTDLGSSQLAVEDHTIYGTSTAINAANITAPMGASLVANIGTYVDGYAYYVELVNNSGSVYARSNAVMAETASGLSYDSLASTGHLVSDLGVGNLASITPWHAGSYTVVPEPTSAILMLFGAAFLGLKRKNRSLA